MAENDYYQRLSEMNPGELADGLAMEAEFDAIGRGFAKLPAPHRDGKGFEGPLRVGDATNDDEAVSKSQLDEEVAKRQPLSDTLNALAGLPIINDSFFYFDEGGVLKSAPITAFVRTLLNDANAGEALATLGALPTSQKGGANGLASLDSGGKVPIEQVPAVAITNTFPVSSEAEMLALDAQPGDVAIRNDVSTSFILMQAPASALQNWKELLSNSYLQVKNAVSQFSGSLAPAASWDDIPSHSDPDLGPSLNSQALVLAARSELLRINMHEALRRSYAKAGYKLRPEPESFENGGTLTSAVDVLLDETTGKVYSVNGPYPYPVAKGTNPSSGGFINRSGKLDYETSVIELGAVPDYLLPDGSVNPSPTDNWSVFNDIFNGIDKYRGMHLFIPAGSFYLSKQLDVVYQTNNPWLTPFGVGQLHIRGAGLGSAHLVFPKTSNYGLSLNTASPILSNLFIEGFSLVRVGFNPDDYQARPYIETFDFSGEPLFGVGLDVRQNGYIGGIHDIGISGFYAGMRSRNVYNGRISGIFQPPGQAIYGFIGAANTTLSIEDGNFWGYQAMFCSSGGTNYLKNVVCEGNMNAFNARPDLLNKFAGHSFWQSGGQLDMDICYTEKCVGYARGLVNCNYNENGGIASNGLGYHYYTSVPADALSPALKSVIDQVNPNLISTYFKASDANTRVKGSIENSLSYATDVYWIEDTQLAAGALYTNCFSMHGTIKTSGGFQATLDSVFKKHIPSDLSFPTAFSTSSYAMYQQPTRFTGHTRVSQDYYNNYNGYGIGGWDRRTDPMAAKATVGLDLIMNLDGALTFNYSKKDVDGVSVATGTPLIINKNGIITDQLWLKGDNGTNYRIHVNTSGQLVASTS